MVKLSVLIKGIVLYLLFVIGISILTLIFKKKREPNEVELIVQRIKEELGVKEKFDAIYGNPERPLGMGYKPEYINNQKIPEQVPTVSEEDKLIKEVNERLLFSNMTGSNGNVYTNLNNENNINYIPLVTTNNFDYSPISFNWDTLNQQEQLHNHPAAQIENITYKIPENPSNGLFLPDHLGIDPAEYHNKQYNQWS
jgi:hypothetical protein